MVLQPLRCRNTLGLGYSVFARHYLRNHYCFLFLQILRCFSSLGSPPVGLKGCPIRKSSDLCLLAATRSLSQLATSFIVSGCQGIHRIPFSFFFSKLLRLTQCKLYNGRFPKLNLTLRSLYATVYPIQSVNKRLPSLDRLTGAEYTGSSGVRKSRRLANCIGVEPIETPDGSIFPLKNVSQVMWRMSDSNRRPPACKAGALAN